MTYGGCRIAGGGTFLLALLCLAHLVQSQQSLTRKHLADQARHLRNPPPVERVQSRRADHFNDNLEDREEFNRILNPILRVRVPDTEGNRQVRKFIIQEMQALGWKVEEDKFRDNTPIGQKEFSNVIATLNPSAPRRLILACHYDSKLTPIGFLGATDSAVPCAQMIHLAQVMDRDLKNNKNNDVTLQMVFFDGEEPFVAWIGEDNTYGARHLASRWEKQGVLKGIDALVLLDLLGAKNPTITSLDPKTDAWHKHLRDIENFVVGRDRSMPNSKIFRDADATGHTGIEDDHIPFYKRDVPVLHLISAPFPRVWHTNKDTRKAIDYPTVWKLNRILRTFVANYLSL